MTIRPLDSNRLRLVTDPARLPFDSTGALAPPLGPVGQDRAMRALRFGAGMAQPGYNLFVTGPIGSGKRSAVKLALEQLAAAMPAAPDIVYVFNFDQPQRPRALRFAAGEGTRFRVAMIELIADLKRAMPRLFESEEYRARRTALEQEFHRAAERDITELRRAAEAQGLALVERGDGGFDFRPTRDGLPLSDEDYRRLPKHERDRLTEQARVLRATLQETLDRLEALRLSTIEKIHVLDRELGEKVLRAIIAPLAERYTRHREAHEHILRLYRDAVTQIDALQALARGEELREAVPLFRYEANLIVDNASAKGAPVLTLDHPSLANLVGRIDHMTVLMSVVSDFRHIRAGALHAANGGFLLIDALDLVRQEAAWEALKRALRARQVRIESLSELHDRAQATSLRPEVVPLDIKIVLFGEAWVYYRLAQADSDFADLFKVQADFSTTAERDDVNCTDLLATMAGIARAEGLKQLDRSGAARLIDEAARLAGDAEKISVRTGRLADLLREGDHFASVAGRSLISGEDIAQAVEAREDRAGRIKSLERERILRRIIYIDTEGSKVGQVNGLTIAMAGGATFGMPARITAQVAPGEGRVIDIERVAEQSGPSHIKGVQILSGYLSGAYATGKPLSVSASIAFEQTYGPVDGDSASAGELIAILSAIAGVPLKQSIAITGSINQHGQIQPIGGANEKIEGFFDVCAARGLDGRQGVVIPKTNIVTLMLRDDVVDAVRRGLFSIFAVDCVDEAIAVLSGMTPGKRGRDGMFQRGSFNRRVQDRLIDFARPRLLKPVNLDPWWRI